MDEIWTAFSTAGHLVITADADLVEIILLSLRVNLGALTIASLIALPLAACVALFRFPGRRLVVVLLNAAMGLPPVVVGLVVYLLLSRAGPLGVFGLLFTPGAMIAAQVILITPIIASIARQALAGLWSEYAEQFKSLGISSGERILALLWDARFALLTAILAGFGRAAAEVGAVFIVGGNIDHATRVMTTAIALEVSRGDVSLAMALGIVLLAMSLSINALTYLMSERLEGRQRASWDKP